LLMLELEMEECAMYALSVLMMQVDKTGFVAKETMETKRWCVRVVCLSVCREE